MPSREDAGSVYQAKSGQRELLSYKNVWSRDRTNTTQEEREVPLSLPYSISHFLSPSPFLHLSLLLSGFLPLHLPLPLSSPSILVSPSISLLHPPNSVTDLPAPPHSFTDLPVWHGRPSLSQLKWMGVDVCVYVRRCPSDLTARE